ncbi:MAG: alpha/beta hydrolase [Gammaproteobacteria bacterium]|nr:alpha/beta hydrolase [Gammaproteobacteria bacterium]
MNFSEYAEQIKALGRELTPDALGGTRAVVELLIPDNFLDGITVSRDIAYGDHERHRLDVFNAEGGSSLKPVLLFVHGGGFIAGDKHADGSAFYSNIGAWAAKNGFAGVNMAYRLAPEHPWPAGSEDIRKAIEFIQSEGNDYGLDANNLFLMGQSAGGAHAAGYLAHPELYNNEAHGVKGAILLSAVYDYVTMPTTRMEQAYLGDDETLYFDRSALQGLLEVDIPLLISTAEYDPPKFQAQALQFLNAWQGKKGEMPNYVHMLGQNHLSVALYLGLPEDQLAPQLQRFITEHMA